MFSQHEDNQVFRITHTYINSMRSASYRSFFKDLTYGNSEDFYTPPIFSIYEIEQEPLKWLKRLLLVRLGLSSMKVLDSEINRFSINALFEAKTLCHELASKATDSNQDFMIVLKIVPKDSVGLIPNYRIYHVNQVDEIFSKLSTNFCNTTSELWFCLSITDNKTLSLGGRLIIPGDYSPQIIELVWYTSPRRIEEFRVSNFKYPFLRAKRNPCKLRYEIDLLYVPEVYSKDNPIIQQKYQSEGMWVIKEVWSYKEKIEELLSSVFKAGAKEISLEFRVNAGNLAFIDWDTGIELL